MVENGGGTSYLSAQLFLNLSFHVYYFVEIWFPVEVFCRRNHSLSARNPISLYIEEVAIYPFRTLYKTNVQ